MDLFLMNILIRILCFLFLFTSQDVNICLDTYSDGTHSLQRIHWWASVVMLNLTKSVPIKKQTHLYLGWPEGEYIFMNVNFWMNYSFNPQPVLGVYMTPVDIFLINKNGSLHLSGIKFCDFSYII